MTSETKLPELLPCPFCGGEAEHEGGGKCCAVACVKCGACSGWQGSEAEAIAAWNTRAAVDAVDWMNHPETIAAKAQWDAVAAILGADGDCPDSVMKAARAALSAASPGAGVTEALAKQFASNEQHERHNTNEETRYWCDQWKLLARQALSAARGE